MMSYYPKIWNCLRSNRPLLMLLVMLMLLLTTMNFTYRPPAPNSLHDRGTSNTKIQLSGSRFDRDQGVETDRHQEDTVPDKPAKKGGKDNIKEQNKIKNKNQVEDELVEDKLDQDYLGGNKKETDLGHQENEQTDGASSNGFFGFFGSVANSDWLKQFQPSASVFRDPSPAAWDAEFDEDEDNNNDKIYKDKRGDENKQDKEDEIGEKGKGEEKSDSGEQHNAEGEDKTTKKFGENETEPDGEENNDKQDEIEGEKFDNSRSSKVKWPSQLNDQDLIEIFKDKLGNITGKVKNLGDTCHNKFTRANSCEDGKCQQTKLPAEPEERVRQLIQNPDLKLSTSHHAVLREMASKVRGPYDVILLTAASSNHFLESQALLQNLHKNVFPVLKNFTLLFYDIGLTPEERGEMETHCQCQVLSFPFGNLPAHLANLKCYAWKPLMIKAHLRQANVLLWLDASIRFNGDPGQLRQLVQRVQDRGVQIGSSNSDTTFRSFRSLYHFFGDEPCMYLGMGQAKATVGGYHNEPFVERVVLEPWAACGLHQDCMCPDNGLSAGCAESKRVAENYARNKGPIVYGLCHRFDQSTISLILHKLYQGSYLWVMMNVHDYGDILRDNQVEYFKTLR